MMQPTQPPQGASPDQYKQWLMSLPPEQRQAALDRLLRDYGLESDYNAMQYRNATDIQDQPDVTRTGGRFGTTVAASPLEHAASAFHNYKKYSDQKALEGKMDQAVQNSSQAGADVANAKFLQGQPPASHSGRPESEIERKRRLLMEQLGLGTGPLRA